MILGLLKDLLNKGCQFIIYKLNSNKKLHPECQAASYKIVDSIILAYTMF